MLGASLVSLSYFVHMCARAESPTRKVASAIASLICLLQVKDSQTDGLLQVAPGVVGVANERQRQLAADHARHGL